MITRFLTLIASIVGKEVNDDTTPKQSGNDRVASIIKQLEGSCNCQKLKGDGWKITSVDPRFRAVIRTNKNRSSLQYSPKDKKHKQRVKIKVTVDERNNIRIESSGKQLLDVAHRKDVEKLINSARD